MTSLCVIILLAQHFLFDWILQPRWIALNKSKSYAALFFHMLIVTAGFLVVSYLVYSPGIAIAVAWCYGIAHAVQDKLVWSTFRPKRTTHIKRSHSGIA